MNVNYVIVILPLILYSDYVCDICMMGEALLDDMMKIQITELAE
jgi:predicted DsbA family dithiol-disulfide isomerase